MPSEMPGSLSKAPATSVNAPWPSYVDPDTDLASKVINRSAPASLSGSTTRNKLQEHLSLGSTEDPKFSTHAQCRRTLRVKSTYADKGRTGLVETKQEPFGRSACADFVPGANLPSGMQRHYLSRAATPQVRRGSAYGAAKREQ
eukprot:6192511-Pleurochrysis_carterae.AAC.2